MTRYALLSIALLAGCSTAPHLVNENRAAVEFSRLGKGDQRIAQNFYNLGSGDAIRRLYWSEIDSQRNPARTTEAQPVPLQRKYVNIPVPEHMDPDGTLKEASTHAVEIVEWVSAVTKNGKKINLCQ